jgi:methionine-gamma-lyase
MRKKQSIGFDTMAIHGVEEEKHPDFALNAPIFMSSTFQFNSLEEAEEVFSFARDQYVYTRGNNPTLRLLEKRLALLEGGVGTVVFSTGMGAISSVLLSLLKPGDEVLAHRTVYGCSYDFLTKFLPQYKVGCRFANLAGEVGENLLDEKVKVIYLETPANPNLEIIDLHRISQLARRRGIKLVVDNTFATPYFQNPLKLGAHVVVHSATKYLCGHGDALGGAVIALDQEYLHRLKFEYLSKLGGVLSPFNAWLILRGLKTLGLRMRQHQANALSVARYLQSHPRIARVNYPGLPGFPGHELAKKQMRGFGGMLSFEVKDGATAARRLVDNLQLAKLAVSLGDAETLVEHPASMTHRAYPREKLREFGLSESMVRLSVGLEDEEDIVADLEQALDRL